MAITTMAMRATDEKGPVRMTHRPESSMTQHAKTSAVQRARQGVPSPATRAELPYARAREGVTGNQHLARLSRCKRAHIRLLSAAWASAKTKNTNSGRSKSRATN